MTGSLRRVYEGVVQDAIDELGRLPGVGPKGAQRIVEHLLQANDDDVDSLLTALRTMKQHVVFCALCGNYAEEEQCRICQDARRDRSLLCIVEEPKDIVAIERSREFSGIYHVLGGVIDPMNGIGPEQLRIKELMTRLTDSSINEVILATNPSIVGEATSVYLVRMLSPLGVAVSALASGLPVGGDLEYADEATLGRAFSGRRMMNV